MGLRWGGCVVAPALCVVVLLGLLLGECGCQAPAGPQTIQLGGVVGWTDSANVNYTQFMSTVQFKAGDTLRFNNTDIKDHDVYQVYTQEEYDACTGNVSDWTINPNDYYDRLFFEPADRVWFFDTQYCAMGQKVSFTVLNSDGTALLPDGTADPPSLNAVEPDPTAPPAPPDAPLAQAGGPAPNAASPMSQVTMHWATLASLLAACYFAAPAVLGF